MASSVDSRSGAPLALLGLVLVLLGPLSWWLLIDQPYWRRTGLSAWLLIGLAVPLGLVAVRRDPRAWVRGLGLAPLAALGFFAWANFGFARLPEAGAPERIPDFELADQDGRAVNFAELRALGPQLLVFYRGHW